MIVIVCIDDSFGMAFNNRRQSQDRKLREFLFALISGNKLWMNSYSAKQFSENAKQITVSDSFLDEALTGEYCFVENQNIMPYEDKVERIILCKWNRQYPSDRFFDFPLTGWYHTTLADLSGSSHDKITVEEWRK